MPRPPALHGVKSPARLATTSGGLVIVHVRPSGEPARSSCSARGLPSPGLDSAPRRRWWFVGHANDAEASFATNEAKRVQRRSGWAAVASTRSWTVGGDPTGEPQGESTAPQLSGLPRQRSIQSQSMLITTPDLQRATAPSTAFLTA